MNLMNHMWTKIARTYDDFTKKKKVKQNTFFGPVG